MQDLERFGAIVRARREDLGIQQEDMDDHGGPSSTTMSRIERGLGEPSPKTLRKLDKGLRWQSGSAKRTLDGGVPTELEPGYDHPPARWKLAEDSIEYRQRLESARALIAFAIDADAVDNQASSVNLESDDEQMRQQVARLLVDVDRLTQRIHDEATDVTGDLNLLRELKADVLRRRRLERLGRPDTTDDLLTEYFRFLENEDRIGLSGEELHRRFFERMAQSSGDPEKRDDLTAAFGETVSRVSGKESDQGNDQAV